MNRPNDFGGSLEYGPIDIHDDGQPFHYEWEGRVFMISMLCVFKGVYTTDEMRACMESLPPELYHKMSVYERWLYGIENLLESKGIINANDI